ncbi:hypothetical protein E2542_SST22247 [Spatholobus suberectus]|nr:hypothetical protein E2542_SST22247 [Spatholobus suberectus]
MKILTKIQKKKRRASFVEPPRWSRQPPRRELVSVQSGTSATTVSVPTAVSVHAGVDLRILLTTVTTPCCRGVVRHHTSVCRCYSPFHRLPYEPPRTYPSRRSVIRDTSVRTRKWRRRSLKVSEPLSIRRSRRRRAAATCFAAIRHRRRTAHHRAAPVTAQTNPSSLCDFSPIGVSPPPSQRSSCESREEC